MGKVRKVDFSPDEFLVGVAGLGPEDIGIYWVVCSLIMSSGGEGVAQDDERLLRLVNARPSRIQRIIDSLVVKRKLSVNGMKLSNKRAVNEVKSARKRIKTAVNNGGKGGRPPNENNGIAKPDGFIAANPGQKLSPPPSPSPINSITASSEAGPILVVANFDRPPSEHHDFPAFYEAWPVKKARRNAAKAFSAAIKRGATAGEIMAGVACYTRENTDVEMRFLKHPATWLNGDCWKDAAVRPAKVAQRSFKCPL